MPSYLTDTEKATIALTLGTCLGLVQAAKHKAAEDGGALAETVDNLADELDRLRDLLYPPPHRTDPRD